MNDGSISRRITNNITLVLRIYYLMKPKEDADAIAFILDSILPPTPRNFWPYFDEERDISPAVAARSAL